MASRKKTKTVEIKDVETEEIKDTETVDIPEVIVEEAVTDIIAPSKPKASVFPIGSIVFISKEASTDLNGFKLFPQYKKYTYTVEAYDENTEVYSLRKANLLLKLKKGDIVSPSEKHDDALIRRQF